MKYFLLLTTIIYFACNGCSNDPSNKLSTTISLAAVDFTQKVNFLGEVYSTTQSDLKVPRRIHGTIKSIVKSGTFLKKGEIAIEIATTELDENLNREKKRLEKAKRRLRKEKRSIAKDKLGLELVILEKEYAFNLKEKEIFYQTGEKDPKVMKNMDLKLQSLDDKINLLNSRLRNYEVLAKHNSISADEVHKVKKELQKSEITRQITQVEKKQKQQGTTGKEKEKLELEKIMIFKAWEKAKLDLKNKEKTFPLRIEKNELVLKKRKQQIKKLNLMISKTKLKAPQDGYFSVSKHPWQGDYFEVGQRVWRGMKVGEVVDQTKLAVKVKIPEKFIDLLSKDQTIHLISLRTGVQENASKIIRIESFATPYDSDDKKSKKFHWVHATLPQPENFLTGESIEGYVEIKKFTNVFKIPVELATVLEKDSQSATARATNNTTTIKVKGIDQQYRFDCLTRLEDYFVVTAKQKLLEIVYEQIN